MLPNSLRMKNFMSHKESFIDFTLFSSCLIMAVNKNDEQISNGIGKTTIFRAISYVLFDEYEADKVEEIIRDGADGCEVEFVFESDGQKYKTTRGRSKSGPFQYLYVWNIDNWESRLPLSVDFSDACFHVLFFPFEAYESPIFNHNVPIGLRILLTSLNTFTIFSTYSSGVFSNPSCAVFP